jgi:hypothetical protein
MCWAVAVAVAAGVTVGAAEECAAEAEVRAAVAAAHFTVAAQGHRLDIRLRFHDRLQVDREADIPEVAGVRVEQVDRAARTGQALEIFPLRVAGQAEEQAADQAED